MTVRFLRSGANQLKYLHLLYEHDVLTTKQIAYLLGNSPNTAQKYLSELKLMGFAVDLPVGQTRYWNLLPLGAKRYEALTGVALAHHVTTLRQNAKSKQAIRHDAKCTNTVMAMIQSADGETNGIYEWYGPTKSRTLYTYQRDGESFKRTSYHPDAVIGFYAGGGFGRMYVEFDTGTQYAETWGNKVRKANSKLNIDGHGNRNRMIVAFITVKGNERKWNIVNSMREFYSGRTRLLVIVATYEEVLSGRVWSPIWATNKSEARCFGLDELAPFEYETGGAPLLVGTEEWRQSLLEGKLYPGFEDSFAERAVE